MKIYIILITIGIFLMTNNMYSQQYAVSISPTPVLNSPDFSAVFGGADGKSIPTDNQGLIREMEFVAFPGTIFEILDVINNDGNEILHVKCDSYVYNADLYIDKRFVKVQTEKPVYIKPELPSKKEIYRCLDRAVGSKYVWGGNYISGVSKLLEYYIPSSQLSDEMKSLWILKGCDCSGLMYEATNGYTERNTSKLINYGSPVNIEGKSADEIFNIVKPLDMMVWKGHVIYVYDEITAIQSSLSMGGVVKTDLLQTIERLMESRTPVNDYDTGNGDRFVIRRWYE
ncbi:MAG: peptidoglycan endopeptidase [Ignavibacteriae bacterium]|nr:MAG: peptidoglycan endopeptidase [Ignavibacteriota bacterium]